MRQHGVRSERGPGAATTSNGNEKSEKRWSEEARECQHDSGHVPSVLVGPIEYRRDFGGSPAGTRRIPQEDPMRHPNYRCPKCDNLDCETAVFRATGGFLAKIFDVQSTKFTTVTCQRCRYTELYKADTSMLGNIFDLFTR
jgi:predicted nucleic-acid-binding Zn-ribbon protein